MCDVTFFLSYQLRMKHSRNVVNQQYVVQLHLQNQHKSKKTKRKTVKFANNVLPVVSLFLKFGIFNRFPDILYIPDIFRVSVTFKNLKMFVLQCKPQLGDYVYPVISVWNWLVLNIFIPLLIRLFLLFLQVICIQNFGNPVFLPFLGFQRPQNALSLPRKLQHKETYMGYPKIQPL